MVRARESNLAQSAQCTHNILQEMNSKNLFAFAPRTKTAGMTYISQKVSLKSQIHHFINVGQLVVIGSIIT